jgi:hypothetical protein
MPRLFTPGLVCEVSYPFADAPSGNEPDRCLVGLESRFVPCAESQFGHSLAGGGKPGKKLHMKGQNVVKKLQILCIADSRTTGLIAIPRRDYPRFTTEGSMASVLVVPYACTRGDFPPRTQDCPSPLTVAHVQPCSLA